MWRITFYDSGITIESGEDIGLAIKNVTGIYVAKLEPNREKVNILCLTIYNVQIISLIIF